MNFSPRVTFALLAYNQEPFIRHAVRAALAQQYDPLEILISDDFSSDATWDAIEDEVRRYNGSHTVILNRNRTNLGITSHLNLIFSKASGDLVVVAAGDDVSLPHRTSALVNAWFTAGRPDGALHSAAQIICDDPRLNGLIKKGAGSDISATDARSYLRNRGRALIHGATAAYTPSVMARFGALSPGGTIEDRPLTFRALLIGRLVFVDQVLVQYRVNARNVSAPKTLANPAGWRTWMAEHRRSIATSLADYEHFCVDQCVEPNREIIRGFQALDRAYLTAAGMADGRLWRILRGLLAYPEPRTLTDRIYFAFHFANAERTTFYNFLRRTLAPLRSRH